MGKNQKSGFKFNNSKWPTLSLLSLRNWAVENGIRGENCQDSVHATENVCETVVQPECVDRTIRCNPLQNTFHRTDVEQINTPNPNDLTEYGTELKLSCPNTNYYFDFSVPDDLISFYYSLNINVTSLFCNKDRWVPLMIFP